MTSSRVLPRKIDIYLRTLHGLYERGNQSRLCEIVVNAGATVDEDQDFDNWNGGTYGHGVILTLPEDLFLETFDSKHELEDQIKEDLQKLHKEPNEYFSEVSFEMDAPEEDQGWREDSDAYRRKTRSIPISKNALVRIWGTGLVRLFLSHKATVKIEASELKKALASYGISAFVAHEDIEPTEEWQREIERALFSMDALAAILTDDFPDSAWTDQEVGVALGREVPVIGVRVGKDPYGLMGKWQGLGGCSLKNPAGMAANIHNLLHKRLSDKSGLFTGALEVYKTSKSFQASGENVKLFTRFEKLESTQIDAVLAAYRANEQNKDSFAGRAILLPLLKKWTGEPWKVEDDDLVPATQSSEGEIPF